MFTRVSSWFGDAVSWIRGKDGKYWKKFARHWGVAAVLICVGIWLGGWLGEQHYWIDLRYRIYERQTRNLAHPTYNRRTVLVMVGDEEFWKGGGLAGRTPTNRSYLAGLLRAVGRAGPEVIALDFRLRSPTPDGAPVPYKVYEEETLDFVRAVEEVTAGSTTVVLPKSLGEDEGGYILESDIYDGRLDTTRGKVRTGYIELDDDLRKVPLDLKLKGGGRLDSFSLAIVRAAEGTPPLPSHDNNSMPYGSFMRPSEFKRLTASEVLAGGEETLKSLAHKVVIIGGNWHNLSYGRGHWVDGFNTPVGEMAGAYVHANYVNSLMSSGVTAPLDGKMNKGIEVFVSFVVATLFFVPIRPALKFIAFFLLAAGLLVISYFLWQNLGLYFDFFIPMALLAGHFVVEHWLHLREELAELRREARRPAPAPEAALA